MQHGSGILAESALTKHSLPANFDNNLALAQKLQTVPEDALPLAQANINVRPSQMEVQPARRCSGSEPELSIKI